MRRITKQILKDEKMEGWKDGRMETSEASNLPRFQSRKQAKRPCVSSLIHNIVLLTLIILQPSCYTSHYYELPNNNPMSQLEEKYSVYLDSTWTTKQAHALLKVFEAISPNLNLQFSRWRITDDGLENDIKIESKDQIKFVTVSKDVFPVEGSQEVLSPGKHLYYAVIQYVTENGTNRAIIELILQKRYGIYVPSYDSSTDASSTELTEGIRNIGSTRYSNFENKDLMLIISVFEAFPQALHKIPRLQYIIRRIDKDESESEKGISYARTGRGHIEFAESVFRHGNSNRARHVIAHEKAHFLWTYVFKREVRADWAKLGGWYQDSTSESGWSTTKDRSAFVSAYASERNPNEDMAESIASYLLYPHRLRSCCPEKYEFIHELMLVYVERWGTSNFFI